ncbi:hypothetical protein SESBI_27329 [Sesbania bispinosa]|nr:hypothetical protein SESBI_27329 [Sesbania bispinosa]
MGENWDQVDNVDSHGDAAAFVAEDAVVAFAVDDGFGGRAKAELIEEGLNESLLLGLGDGARESELNREHEPKTFQCWPTFYK